ncbi:RICIN domain-containing protein, partial [Kibdelosporangium lantanae]
MWRRIVTGVVVAGAVATAVLVVGQPDTRMPGIVVPQSDTGESAVPEVTVHAAAAEPTAVSTISVTQTIGPPTLQLPTTRPTAQPPTSTRSSSTTTTTTKPVPTPPRFDPSASYRIVNYVNSLVLDSGGEVPLGSAMKLWEPHSPSTNLQFQLVETGGGYYRLVNRTNGLTVDGRGATTAGAYLGQRLWDSGAAMQWAPTDVGHGLFV